jgi:hypothetical protein
MTRALVDQDVGTSFPLQEKRTRPVDAQHLDCLPESIKDKGRLGPTGSSGLTKTWAA